MKRTAKDKPKIDWSRVDVLRAKPSGTPPPWLILMLGR
jgi:hypothetical protein